MNSRKDSLMIELEESLNESIAGLREARENKWTENIAAHEANVTRCMENIKVLKAIIIKEEN